MSDETTKSLFELLSEDEEVIEEYECPHCGYKSKTPFKLYCPECHRRIENPTMADCGKKLPIGIEKDGSFRRDFELEPIDWNKEREINKHWGNQRKNLSLGNYIGSILACTVTNIAGQDITKFKIAKKLLILGKMYQADVFYMYAYLRLLSIGKELNFGEVTCASCSHQFPYIGDLTSIEIAVIEQPKDLTKEVKLKDGFEMIGDQKNLITMKPPLWNMFDSQFPTNLNTAEIFFAMLSNSVIGIEGMPDGTKITEQEIRQFSKYDIEICEEAMEDIIAGPRWEVEFECPKCNATSYELIDWSYTDFFAHSSRSPRRKRRSRRLSP